MTTIQMNAELFRQLSVITANEGLLEKLLKYARKLTASKQDPTLLTKEEFFRRVDEAREEIKQGKGYRMLPDESLDDFLKRVG